jgi:hypothetical protein
MKYPTSILSLLLVAFPAVMGQSDGSGRSDRVCSYDGYSSICDCDYYASVNCKNYYYNNGEGGSYKPKNFEWDKQCAACCCSSKLNHGWLKKQPGVSNSDIYEEFLILPFLAS